MTTTLEERYKRLLLAANALLENHMDLGDCFVDEDNDDDDYPTDSDGDRWYHDWFELREAINECESHEVETTPAMPEITRQALDAGKIVHTGWTPNRDTADQCGVNVLDYFDASGKFLGADENGLEPIFETAETQIQRRWDDVDHEEIPELVFELMQTRRPIEVRLRDSRDDEWSNEQLVGFRLDVDGDFSAVYFVDRNGGEWLRCQVYRQPVAAQ